MPCGPHVEQGLSRHLLSKEVVVVAGSSLRWVSSTSLSLNNQESQLIPMKTSTLAVLHL